VHKLEPVSLVIKKGTLRWFGHEECKDDTDWIKLCRMMEVERTKPTGRLRKTWCDDVKEDMKRFGQSQEDALSWR